MPVGSEALSEKLPSFSSAGLSSRTLRRSCRGKEDPLARGIVGKRIRTAFQRETRDHRRACGAARKRSARGGVRKVDAHDGLCLRKSDVENMRAWDDEERVGRGFDRNGALDLPVVGRDHHDVAGSGVGDVNQMRGFIDGHAARRPHVADVSHDPALLGVEEIDRPGSRMGDQNHAVNQGNFIESGLAGKIQNRNLPESGSGGCNQK